MLQQLYQKFNTKLKLGCRQLSPRTQTAIVWLLSILYLISVWYMIIHLFI